MRHLGVSARPVTVKVNIYNGSYVELERHLGHRPDPGTTQDGAWVVGIGFQREQGGIGTHIVAVLDDRILVDASMTKPTIPSTASSSPVSYGHRLTRRSFQGSLSRVASQGNV